MKKSTLIIDPFVKVPVVNCINSLIKFTNGSCEVAFPAAFPLSSMPLSDEYEAIYILGSASHPKENLLWQKELASFAHQQLLKNVPVFGFCFGHQLMVHYFGGDVDFAYPDERKILGHREMKIGNEKFSLGVSHRQVVKKLPTVFESLAISDYGSDVIVHKTLPLFCTQAHPEASSHFLKNDCSISDEKMISQCLHDGQAFIKFLHKRAGK